MDTTVFSVLDSVGLKYNFIHKLEIGLSAKV